MLKIRYKYKYSLETQKTLEYAGTISPAAENRRYDRSPVQYWSDYGRPGRAFRMDEAAGIPEILRGLSDAVRIRDLSADGTRKPLSLQNSGSPGRPEGN